MASLIVKPANTSRTSTAVLAADPDLTVAVLATDIKRIDIRVRFQVLASGGGLQLGFALPTGAVADTIYPFLIEYTNYAPVFLNEPIAHGTDVWQVEAKPFARSGNIFGSIIVKMDGVNAGNIAVSWAQITSNASATTIGARSCMTVLP